MFLLWGSNVGNGGVVPLRVTRMVGYSAIAEFDPSGVDYLYTTYTVSVEACWGRFADGYTVQALTPQGPVPRLLADALRGVANGVQSVVALRHALAQPHQPFVLYSINPVNNQADVLLASGSNDAANGPRMIEPPAVQSIHGQGSLVFVRLTFEVSISDCPIYDAPQLSGVREIRTGANEVKNPVRSRRLRPNAVAAVVGGAAVSAAKVESRRVKQFDATELAKARGDLGLQLLSLNGRPILLSNRWTQSVSYDPQTESPSYRLTGQATFRRDGLHAFRVASIDSFRGALLPTVPDNCVREINDITVSADGLTLVYDVVDRMQVRSYVDWRVRKGGADEARLVDVSEKPRNVAKVSLVSRREYIPPSVGNAAFDFIDHLSTVNFALPGETADAAEKIAAAAVNAAAGTAAAGPVGLAVGAAVGAIGADTGKEFLKWGLAAARTVNNTLPRTVESAAAEVQITREGTLADGQALCFPLISGALDYGTGADDGRISFGKAAQVLRFTLLAPANSISLECDHVNGIVRAAMQIEQSGIGDYCLLGQINAYKKLMDSLSKTRWSGGFRRRPTSTSSN